MYARIKKRDHYEYVQIVEAYRNEQGRPRQKVVASLGRLETCIEEGVIDSLILSLSRFSQDLMILAESKDVSAEALKIGPGLIFERLWKDLGIGDVIKDLLKEQGRRFEFDVERAIFLTVMHRLFSGGSDRAAEKWARCYKFEGVSGLGLHHLYRAMYWLGGANGKGVIKDEIEEQLFFRNRHLFSELQIVFFDTTSLYFHGDGGKYLGKRGHSKDHRPDLKQMVVGVVIDDKGRPVCCELWPGNRVDVKSLVPVAKRLRDRFRVATRFCIVADRGMVSNENMEKLEQAGIDYILGVKMRKVKEVSEDILVRGGRWKEVPLRHKKGSKKGSFLKVKESYQGGRRYIVCLNEDEAKRDALVREAILQSLNEALCKGAKNLIGNRGYRKYLKIDGDAIWIDKEKLKQEARYDGKWVLRTSVQDMSASDVALKYKELWQVERVFRDIKCVLETRPIYHRVDETIRGHVFCSFLALVLRKELDNRLYDKGYRFEWNDIKQDLELLQEIELKASGKRFLVRTECKGVCGKVFQAARVRIPPRVRPVREDQPVVPRPVRTRLTKRSATDQKALQ